MKYDHQQVINSKNKDIVRLLQIIDKRERQLDVLEQWIAHNQRRSPQHVVCRTHTSVS